MKTLQLRERTCKQGVLLSVAERDLLRGRFSAKVQPTKGRDGHFDVTPIEKVGAAVVGDTAIVIEPKIEMSRLLFLLEYAADPTQWRDDHAAYGTAPDLMTAMASLFARLAGQATQRGLLTGYRQLDEDLHTVRGRIDLATQVRRRPGLDLPIAVTYQHYDEEILENKLLAAAVRLLRLLPIQHPATRQSLARLASTLRDVVSAPMTSLAPIVWNRNNAHYRPAVEVARLILQDSSVDISSGGATAPAVIINMANVFEQFVRSALRHSLGATDDEFPTGSKASLHLDTESTVVLKPDLSLYHNGRRVFVGDVKYKRDWTAALNHDLYQLLAYATGTGLPEATLIYAEGESAPAVHHIPGPGITIYRRRLDLTAAPVDLLQQIDTLAAAMRAPSAHSAL